MTNWLEELVEDHGRIERALVLIERQANRDDGFDGATVCAMFDLLFEYGEKYHNRKEEEVLFPRIGERGIPTQGGPVAVMLAEHQMECDYLRKLMPESNAVKDGLSAPSQEYRQELLAYVELTKGHIWKENDILYPMARRVLTEADVEWLSKEFRRLDRDLPFMGIDFVRRWDDLLKAVEEASGGRVDLLASLPTETIRAMLDALPVEVTFVDAEDTVRYFNKVYEKKIFLRTLSVVGRKIQQCHPPKSVHLVNKIISEMKAGTRTSAEFWIPFGEQREMLVHISYYAVRDPKGKYLGCVEMTHDIAPYRALEGEARTLADL